MEKTVIVTPTYNERENIALLIPEIFALHPDIYVVVVDDSSPDGTGDLVLSLAEKYPHLSLFSRPTKQGLGEAYKAGMTKVLKDPDVTRVITMDADGSHAAQYLAAMLEKSATHDVVIGSRYVKGGGIAAWEAWRYALSAGGNLYARFITGLPINDMTAGFMCFNAHLLRQLPLSRMHAAGYAFLMEIKFEIIYSLKGSVTEVPIIFQSRRGGESKISQQIVREGLKVPWRLLFRRFTKRPIATQS